MGKIIMMTKTRIKLQIKKNMRIKSKWAFKAGQNLKQPREGNIATFHVLGTSTCNV